MIRQTKWWTVCGKPGCDKRFEVVAMSNLSNQEIEKVFIEKYGVHLFPSRCKEHYEEQLEAESL